MTVRRDFAQRLHSGAGRTTLAIAIAVMIGATAVLAEYLDSSTPSEDTMPSSDGPVTIPDPDNGETPVDNGAEPAPEPAKEYHNLSEYLWRGAKSDHDDDQGKFLDAVAKEIIRTNTATPPQALKSPLLHISDDRRYLQYPDGKPFYWMSDTAWALLYRLYMNERRDYLQVRVDQGFNVLLFQLLGGGMSDKDLSGNAVFTASVLDYGPSVTRQTNVKFWARARRAVEDISKTGMIPAMIVAWGAHARKGLFDEAAAYDYGRLVGRTFGDMNVIFVLGGDINPKDTEKPIWEAMARGLRAGEAHRNLITFHPASGAASDYFGNSDWLDIDAMQSGHSRFRTRATAIGEVTYQRYIANQGRPLVDVESGYENIPDGLYSNEPDTSRSVPAERRLDSYDMRVRAYQQWVSGAMGYGYGQVDDIKLWNFSMAPFWPTNQHWRDAQNAEGATQLRHFQKLRAEMGMASPVPVGEWSELSRTINDYFRTLTACNPDRSMCVSYDTDGAIVHFPFDAGRFSNCNWMDPRTGARQSCTDVRPGKQGGTDYVPPVFLNSPMTKDGKAFLNKNDWVLILKN